MPDSPAAAAGDTIGVLICDDVDAIRRLLVIVVELDPGLRVAGVAPDGRAAINQAEQLQPDVILLDLSMPALTGFEALPAIKAAAPAARIIAFSGFASSIVERAVLDAGADGFLEKGASAWEIITAIKDAYAAGRDRVESGPLGSTGGR
jgi:DNA-binding NarL/FixJ family response regulator